MMGMMTSGIAMQHRINLLKSLLMWFIYSYFRIDEPAHIAQPVQVEPQQLEPVGGFDVDQPDFAQQQDFVQQPNFARQTEFKSPEL